MRSGVSAILVLCFLVLISNDLLADSNKDRRLEIDKWVNAMMSGAKSTSGVLALQRFKDPMYIVIKPFTWESEGQNINYKSVTVPVGFVTDLTSVPSIFWSTLRPDGDYVNAAIVHDFLYWTQERDRHEADNILNIIMKEFEIPWLKRNAIFQGVDKFGKVAWNKNRKKRLSGERHYLKKFPQDPKVTWQQWSVEPDVFYDYALTEQ